MCFDLQKFSATLRQVFSQGGVDLMSPWSHGVESMLAQPVRRRTHKVGSPNHTGGVVLGENFGELC